MSLGEFDLIARYFTHPTPHAVLGPGDDCAVLALNPGMQMAVSTDMLVEGRHFFADVEPAALGHKALAVNLSDLAACGARPMGFTLALALPRPDDAWLQAFAQGLMALAREHGCDLIGGDTTAGPVATISITVLGEVPAASAPPGTAALLRSGARAGDDVWVSGRLGDARLALECLRGSIKLDGTALAQVRQALERPVPRVTLGLALRGIATSAIDLSDGLLGDLGHVLERSQVGAVLDADAVPRSAILQTQPPDRQRECTLSGGDDYELAFTAAPSRRDQVLQAARAAGVAVTRIGRIEAEPGFRLVDAAGQALAFAGRSFDHFRA